MILFFIFFFKQKTAYEMRISDWSSDVCSSDLWRWEWRPALAGRFVNGGLHRRWAAVATVLQSTVRPAIAGRGSPARGGSRAFLAALQIGRASCRERVCQYV